MKQQFDALVAKWKALSPGRRTIAGVALAAALIVGYVGYSRVNATSWAVLYANLDDQTASEVLAELDARGVPYTLEGNGTRILVPEERLASTRLSLAGDGVSGQPIPPGFDEVFSGQGLATSDFEQRVNYERALEGELARTLLAMEPVAGANVQLSLPERSIYIGAGAAETDQPTASVVLSVRRPLTSDEVDTVANVVSSSVEGLSPDQVTVASADGQLLRAARSSGAQTSTHAMDVTREYESALSQRLTELVRISTGSKTATVEVRAQLDFTESTTETERIDPATNTPTAERVMTETWEGSGGSQGGTVGVDGGPAGSGGDGTYEKEDRTTTYTPGDRTITRSSTSSPTVTRLDVAVVVPVVAPEADAAAAAGAAPATPIDEETLQRLVSSAAGVDAGRGDSVAIAIVPAVATDGGTLITSPEPIASPSPSTSPALIAAAAAGGAFLMLALGIVRRRRRARRERARAALAAFNAGELAHPTTVAGRRKRRGRKKEAPTPMPVPAALQIDGPTDPDRQAVDEIRADLERMLAESPESLAALLSSWMAK